MRLFAIVAAMLVRSSSSQAQSLPSSLQPPASNDVYDTWIANLSSWRVQELAATTYADDLVSGATLYNNVKWASSVSLQFHIMAYDRRLYDTAKQNWTVSTFWGDVIARFGVGASLDSVVL